MVLELIRWPVLSSPYLVINIRLVRLQLLSPMRFMRVVTLTSGSCGLGNASPKGKSAVPGTTDPA